MANKSDKTLEESIYDLSHTGIAGMKVQLYRCIKKRQYLPFGTIVSGSLQEDNKIIIFHHTGWWIDNRDFFIKLINE